MHLLYQFSLKRVLLYTLLVVSAFLLFTRNSDAASFSSASATLTTSRPSASSPLSANAAAGAGQLSIFNNGSHFLASDSARIVRGTGIVSNNNLAVASQSGALTTVYLATTLGTAAGAGADILMMPITAMHMVSFKTSTSIPSGGKIVITYPGAANNTASPSASTFAFNNLTAANVVSEPATGCNSPAGVTISSPTITCTTSGVIGANTVVTILIGCSAQTNGSCTTQVPTLINPTKSSSSTCSGSPESCTADVWKIGIRSTDASDITLDNSTVGVGIEESVIVRATIDPSLSFSITGIANGTLLSGVNTGCSQADTTNTGITSAATDVNLGVLSIAPAANVTISNIAAQNLTVATNGANGYSITATSSGSLRNPATGFFFNTSTNPVAFPASGHFFGLHACGMDTDLVRWNSTAPTDCNTRVSGSTGNVCQYAWPTATGPMLIAEDTTGPVGEVITAGNGKTIVSYAATQDVTLPPGEYQTVVTYVATPSF